MACIETRNITVKATPDAGAKNGIGFDLLENGVSLNGEIDCQKGPRHKKKSDWHEFVFTLDDCTNVGLLFQPVVDDAIWVNKQGWWPFGGCPKKKKGHPHIEPIQVLPGQLSLVVHNHNPEKADYKFTLNFVTQEKQPRDIPYDPIWHNQNGGVDG